MDLDDASLPPLSLGPRERALAEGIASLGDADLLAVLLGTGVAGRPVTFVAAALLDGFGGLEGLSRLGPAALAEQRGVGMAKALRVAAALELGARAARRPTVAPATLTNSAEVAAHLEPRIARLPHEEMWLVCLDGRNRVRGLRRVAQGGLHGLSVQPRDVLRAAIYEAASAIILVHNHPSGDPTPSPEDLVLTRKIVEAAGAIGVPLVDHVIIAPSGRYASLLDLGVIEPP
jgi:DNA repair protein RadC